MRKAVATFALIMGCASLAEGMARRGRQAAEALRYRLTARESYSLGQPVTIGFELENLSGDTQYVLTWYTPLEGIKGKIFQVLRNGEEIPYEGPMVKRGEPGANDYVEIPLERSVSVEVDLSEAYNLSQPGQYSVKFRAQIYDLTRDRRSVPRPRDKHRGLAIPGNAVSFQLLKP